MTTATVAIISDTHGFLDPRIADIIRHCDFAIHAGDICSSSVIAAMHPKTEVVIAVLGNNDPHYMPEVSLPWCTDLKVPGGIIAVEHGHAQGHHSPSHAVLRRRHPQARVVVYGHTHKLIIDQTELPWVINPGAAGKMRTHGGPSCLVLTASEGQEWKVQEFRFPLPP